MPDRLDSRRRAARGFTLVELSVVIIIIGLLASIGITSSLTYFESQKLQVTRNRLDAAEEALAAFVSRNKRLPCPANGALASSNANAGFEVRTGTTAASCTANGANQTTGVLPWRSIGLSDDGGVDAWGDYFTYRVYDANGGQTGLVSDNGMDMSGCDPGARLSGSTLTTTAVPTTQGCYTSCTAASLVTSGATAACTNPADFLSTKGLRVRDGGTNAATLLLDPTAGTTTAGGAAYVLISHGRSGLGARTKGGVARDVPTATDELPNSNANSLNGSIPVSAGSDGFVDRTMNDDQTTAISFFDDVVRRPTILTVAIRAGIGPRSH